MVSRLKRSFFWILSTQRYKLYKSSGNKKVNWTFFLNLGPIKNKMMNSISTTLFLLLSKSISLRLKFAYLFNINSSRITICHCSFSTLLLPF